MAKILVVDDSETFRMQLQSDLETAGHQVILAGDGLAGLEALRIHPDTQLIFCDVNMPRLDGLGMCEKIAASNTLKSIPILMLTTESSQEMKALSKSFGVRAWITKPYVVARLLAAVTKLTQG